MQISITLKESGDGDLQFKVLEDLCQDPNREFSVRKDGKKLSVKDARGNDAPELVRSLALKVYNLEAVESVIIKGCTIQVRIRDKYPVKASKYDIAAIIKNVFRWTEQPLVVLN